jgi:hypothetical protein
MANNIDTVIIIFGGIFTLILGFYNWVRFYKEADRDYVEQQLSSKYKDIITEDFEEVRKFTETYRIAMTSIVRKILLAIIMLTLLGVCATYVSQNSPQNQFFKIDDQDQWKCMEDALLQPRLRCNDYTHYHNILGEQSF